MSRIMARLALAALLCVCLLVGTSSAETRRRHRGPIADSHLQHPAAPQSQDQHQTAGPQSQGQGQNQNQNQNQVQHQHQHQQQSESKQASHHDSHSNAHSNTHPNSHSTSHSGQQRGQRQQQQGESVMGQTYSKEIRDLWAQKRASRLKGSFGYNPLDMNSNPVRKANIDRYGQIYGDNMCPAEQCGNNAQDKGLAALAAGHRGFVPDYQSFTDKSIELPQHELGVGSSCTTSADCASSKCVLSKCRECITHGDCDHDSYCTLYTCAPRKANGHYCGTIDECLSNHCVLFKCAPCEDESCYRTSFRSD